MMRAARHQRRSIAATARAEARFHLGMRAYMLAITAITLAYAFGFGAGQ